MAPNLRMVLVLAALAAACSSSTQRTEQPAEPVASPMADDTGARSNDVTPEQAFELARKTLAAEFETSEDDILFERLEPAELPGVYAARGYHRVAGAWIVVAVDRDGAHLGIKATQMILRRWRKGELGELSPAQLARALAFLESGRESTTPVVTQADIDGLPEHWRAHVFVPRRSTIDGLPAIEYWVRSGEPPLYLSQVLARDDGSFERRIKDIWGFL